MDEQEDTEMYFVTKCILPGYMWLQTSQIGQGIGINHTENEVHNLYYVWNAMCANASVCPGVLSSLKYQPLQNLAWAGQTMLSVELVWTDQPGASKPSLSCFFFQHGILAVISGHFLNVLNDFFWSAALRLGMLNSSSPRLFIQAVGASGTFPAPPSMYTWLSGAVFPVELVFMAAD